MLGGFLLWMIGLVLSIYTGVNLAEKHKMDANLKETNTMFVADSSTIKITSIIPDSITDYNVAGYPIENVNLDVVKSVDDTLPSIEITRFSNGRDKQVAQNLANSINYYYTVKGNELQLAPYFMLGKNSKFRGQQVDIKLMLPVGYKVYFDDNSDDVINDIKNIQNVWDSDMPTHTFTMTSKGLNCEDCPDDIIRLDHNKDMDSNQHETVDTLGNVTIKVEHSNDDE